MDKVLEQIRGVMGVIGVLVYDRTSAGIFRLLPSRFDGRISDELESRLTEIVDYLPENASAKMKMRFVSGWLIIRSARRFAVLVIAREEVNIDTLNLVLKASFATLQHTHRANIDAAVARDYDPASPYILIEAMNRIVEFLSMATAKGPMTMAGMLRGAKNALLESCPALKHFSVDNNGRVGLIRGSEKHLDMSIVEAFAHWSHAIKDAVSSSVPIFGFDIVEITKDSESDLTRLGFYSTFRRTTTKPVGKN
jgi:hypothetical protein